jgi:hypothetical protein
MKLLDNYPIAIDPASQIISVRFVLGAKATWQHLQRIPPSRVNRTLPTSNQRCHFFGDGDAFETSELVIAYDAVGSVSDLWYLRRGHWHQVLIPEESTGQVSLHPSVRFVFADTSDRDCFMSNFQQMIEAADNATLIKQSNMLSLIRMVGRAPIPPRELNVVLDRKTNDATR